MVPPLQFTAVITLLLSTVPTLAQTINDSDPTTAVAAGVSDPENNAAALALKLANPVAALISVPIQFNFDSDIDPLDAGERITLNVQPVIPIRLDSEWNMISRTIMPIVWQSNIASGSGEQFGLGDTAQSLFFSPAIPGSAIWGIGPVLLVPTGTDDLLSGHKWGAGPTGVILKQFGTISVGALANHIWSFGGNSSRKDISTSFANPFITNALKSGFSYGINADITYDWKGRNWTIPVSFTVS